MKKSHVANLFNCGVTMAHMNQQQKARLAPGIKAVLAKYQMKATIAVESHSSLVVNIKSGPLDIIGNHNRTLGIEHDRNDRRHCEDYLRVNQYWLHDHYSGNVLEFMQELVAAMNVENHDNSDLMSDYVDIGYWVYINVGSYSKPYRVTDRTYQLA